MSEQFGTQARLLLRPSGDNKEAWRTYWRALGQPWRTEPEIDAERQKYLTERCAIVPNIEKGIYPFKDIKLSRADVEWLLATHENGRGPVDWNDQNQREREGLDVRGADLRSTDLRHLPLARLYGGLVLEWSPTTSDSIFSAVVHLEGANLAEAHLEGAILRSARMEKANLCSARLEEAYLIAAHLENADLVATHLKNANLIIAHLENANLYMACLEKACLDAAHLKNAILGKIQLADEKHIGPKLVDVEWGSSNITTINWSQVHMLGDEYEARQKMCGDTMKNNTLRLDEYEKAVRTNRQVAFTLQAQGLSEEAMRFNYRAQVLQQSVLWLQIIQHGLIFRQRMQKFGALLFSWFLFLLSGYGYKPWRSFLAYLIVIAAFATSYFIIGRIAGPSLSPVGAWVFSMTSFHGRGFFPGGIKLDDPLTVLAALEAFVGLLIEVTFIATLTQRLFGK